METKTISCIKIIMMLQEKPMQVKEIAEELGIARVTIHHYLRTIQKVIKMNKNGYKYSINKIELK